MDRIRTTEQENTHLNTKHVRTSFLRFLSSDLLSASCFSLHRWILAAIRTFCFLLFLMIFLPLTGCGDREDLQQYKMEMENFYHTITSYDSVINQLDPDSPSAAEDLLAALTELNTCFSHMASLPVPREFSAVEALAVEAEEFMSQAVSLYHTAYSSQPFDHVSADAAKEYYDRANTRAVYILQILHGEIPE